MEKKAGPFSGITVIDLTQFLSGPFCTMILADLGAEVIKIERPDRPKASGPFLNGERIYDLSVMRNKKSVTLNLKSPKDKKMFLELVRQADVVAENFKPGTMERMGLGYEELRLVNPRIIYLGISGFGNTGPYRERGALDMVVQGMSGLMSLTGDQNGRPTRVGTSVSDVFTGLYAYGAVASALYYRERTGVGQAIDLAMLDATFSCLENAVVNYCVSGKNPQRMGNRHSTSVPFQTFPASDGEFIITCSRDPAFYDLCRAIGREDMIEDPRFSKAEMRRQNADLLEQEITAFTAAHTIAECEEALARFDVPHGRINTMEMICNDPQIAAREMIVETEHPVAGKYRMAGNPIKFSAFPSGTFHPAPTLGQHNREIFSSMLGMSDEQIDDELTEQAKILIKA